MILDFDGYPLKRRIGFVATIERENSGKADIQVTAVGFSIPCEEHESQEQCNDSDTQ